MKITDKKRYHDGTKLLWHMDRVMDHYDEGKRVPPIHIDIGIAKFCNIGCVFCYGKYQEFQKKFISKDALLNFMRDAGEIGVKSVAIIGDGEPTCNPHFYEALRVGKESGLSLATSTNGFLLDTPERRKAVLENCEWMRFCISAGTREGYQKIHSRDYFDKVVQNIEAMVREKREGNYKCEIGMQAVFVPTLMAEEMVKEAELAVRLGVDYFVIKQCSLPDDGQTGMMQFKLTDYDKPEVIAALKKAESLSTDKTDITVKWGMIQQKTRPYQGCLSVPLIWEVSGNGDCYPCGYFFGDKGYDDLKFGNLEQTSLKDIVNSDRYWGIIEKMKKFNVHKDCKGACRLDKTNEFIYDYLNPPRGRNFI